MCTNCGCPTDADYNLLQNPQLNNKKTLAVVSKILNENDHEAAHIREHFESHGIAGLCFT